MTTCLMLAPHAESLMATNPPDSKQYRGRSYDFEPHVEKCPTPGCTVWIVWRELYLEGSRKRPSKKPRFKCCHECATKEWVGRCA